MADWSTRRRRATPPALDESGHYLTADAVGRVVARDRSGMIAGQPRGCRRGGAAYATARSWPTAGTRSYPLKRRQCLLDRRLAGDGLEGHAGELPIVDGDGEHGGDVVAADAALV